MPGKGTCMRLFSVWLGSRRVHLVVAAMAIALAGGAVAVAASSGWDNSSTASEGPDILANVALAQHSSSSGLAEAPTEPKHQPVCPATTSGGAFVPPSP